MKFNLIGKKIFLIISLLYLITANDLKPRIVENLSGKPKPKTEEESKDLISSSNSNPEMELQTKNYKKAFIKDGFQPENSTVIRKETEISGKEIKQITDFIKKLETPVIVKRENKENKVKASKKEIDNLLESGEGLKKIKSNDILYEGIIYDKNNTSTSSMPKSKLNSSNETIKEYENPVIIKKTKEEVRKKIKEEENVKYDLHVERLVEKMMKKNEEKKKEKNEIKESKEKVQKDVIVNKNEKENNSTIATPIQISKTETDLKDQAILLLETNTKTKNKEKTESTTKTKNKSKSKSKSKSKNKEKKNKVYSELELYNTLEEEKLAEHKHEENKTNAGLKRDNEEALIADSKGRVEGDAVLKKNIIIEGNPSVAEKEKLFIQNFISQFKNTGNIEDFKLKLLNGVSRLDNEILDLSSSLNVDKLKFEKLSAIASKLTKLLDRYEKKSVMDITGSKMKLADEITVKSILKEKIARELQGLRTADIDFPELKDLNPYSVQPIYNEVKDALYRGN